MSFLRQFFKCHTKIYASFSQTELDREYSPSSCVDDMDQFLDRYAELSKAARWRAESQAACQLDVSYGVGPRQKLDLFASFDDSRGPLQVYFHGGYWQMLSKEESSFAAPMFQEHGSHFAAVGYTLAPDATLKEIVEECRLAVAWLFHHAGEYGFDRERIFISGSSAGAHLVAMLLLTDWPQYDVPRGVLKGACAVSGIYELEPIRRSYVDAPLQLSEDDVNALSPLRTLPDSHCPVILAHGSMETDEFKRQTREFYEHLEHAGEEVQCREIMERNHFDVIMDLCDDDSWLAVAVLRQMGLLPAGDERILYRP